MKVPFDAKYISSFLLFLDHRIQNEALAFSNYSGLLYPINSSIQGLYSYATPFKQLCNDTSISGANIMSGVYLNNNFVAIGQSGLYAINHDQGAAYFTSQLPQGTVISGRYSIKDFNVVLTDQIEYKLLFETKYVTNSKFNQVLSGLPLDTKTSPAIFLKVKSSENKPFAFSRIDDNSLKIRAVIIADNEFQKITVGNVLKNLNYSQFNIVNYTPFDYLGNFTGINYNYGNLSFDSTYTCTVMESRIIDIPLSTITDFQSINRNMAMADIVLSIIMTHP